MNSRIKGTLTAMAASALLAAVQLAAASPAHAVCPPGQLEDPNTRICWSQAGTGGAFYTADGGSCTPGRVGDCVGQIKATGPPVTWPGQPTSIWDLEQMGDGGKK